MWFYRTAAGDVGPVTGEEMVRLIEAGEVTETTLVRRETSDQWLEAWQTDRASYMSSMNVSGGVAIGAGEPASVMSRLGAYIIDYIGAVLSAAVAGFIMSLFFEPSTETINWRDSLPQLTLTVVVLFLYYGIPTASPKQATFGMQVLGIQMKRPNGEPITLLRGGVRPLVATISFSVLFLGLIVALFNRERITLHDWVCGTRVVRGEEG